MGAGIMVKMKNTPVTSAIFLCELTWTPFYQRVNDSATSNRRGGFAHTRRASRSCQSATSSPPPEHQHRNQFSGHHRSASEIADRLRWLAQRSLAQLLRPFVVTFYVYTFNQKPEEKWKFPNNRTYANNPAICLVVVGIKYISIGIC